VELHLVVREGKESLFNKYSNVRSLITTPDIFSENTNWWANQCEGIDTVVHLAWFAEPGMYFESKKNIDCLIGSLNLAKGASQSGVKRFIGIGTCVEYDLSGGVLSVETPLKPNSPYACAKTSLYFGLSHWFSKSEIEFAWCRLFYLYGEGEDSRRLLPYIRSQIEKGVHAELSSGKQIRDFMDVADAGQMIAAIVYGHQTGPVNVCSGVPITVRQLAEKLADEYGRRDLLKFGVRSEDLSLSPCILGIPNVVI
jgi:dTDP-6-deoxy-L-talose 4-dehydrogenase (NAD+)